MKMRHEEDKAACSPGLCWIGEIWGRSWEKVVVWVRYWTRFSRKGV